MQPAGAPGPQRVGGAGDGRGLLPARYYRHLVLEAMEAEDFPEALNYLQWAADPLLAQILVLRLRLLAGRHRPATPGHLGTQEADSGAGLRPVKDTGWKPVPLEKYQDLLLAEDRALELLAGYEARALGRVEAERAAK